MNKRSCDSAGLLFVFLLCTSQLAAATESTYPSEILVLPEMLRFDDMGRVLSAQPAVGASRPILIREEGGTLRSKPLQARMVGVERALEARLSTNCRATSG